MFSDGPKHLPFLSVPIVRGTMTSRIAISIGSVAEYGLSLISSYGKSLCLKNGSDLSGGQIDYRNEGKNLPNHHFVSGAVLRTLQESFGVKTSGSPLEVRRTSEPETVVFRDGGDSQKMSG